MKDELETDNEEWREMSVESQTDDIFTTEIEVIEPYSIMEAKGSVAQFLTALLEGETQANAAKRAGISTRTASRIMQDDNFQQELRSAMRRMLQTSEARLTAASSIAITKLIEILEDKETSKATAVRAAATVLEHSLKIADYRAIEIQSEWLARLEIQTY